VFEVAGAADTMLTQAPSMSAHRETKEVVFMSGDCVSSAEMVGYVGGCEESMVRNSAF
jgi:hypothetical protein